MFSLFSRFRRIFERNDEPSVSDPHPFPSGTGEKEREPVEVFASPPTSPFEPADKQRHFGILRYMVNDRFKKMMLFGLLSVVVIISVLVTILVVVLQIGTSPVDDPTTSSLPSVSPMSTTKISTQYQTTAPQKSSASVTVNPSSSTTIAGSAEQLDRVCGSDLSNLWLDVVAVVDNSIGMTNCRLRSIATNILSIFSAGPRIGIDSSENKTTRLGLVTYNAQATLNADLNKFHSVRDIYEDVLSALNAVSDSEDSYLASGLIQAETLLQQQSFNTARDHYKKVVIVYASAFEAYGDSDPHPVARRLKESGVFVITVAYGQDGDLLENLAAIATPGFNFTNDENLQENIQGALIQSNCYCPNDWYQFRESFQDQYSYRYGTCIQPVGLESVWRAAKMSCNQRSKNAYLVTEFSQQKHDFNFDVVKNFAGFFPPLQYHIGLSLINGTWTWDQPAGGPQLQNWFNWLPEYPISNSSLTVVRNFENGDGTAWQNIEGSVAANYICEMYTCDTDNYCDSDGKA